MDFPLAVDCSDGYDDLEIQGNQTCWDGIVSPATETRTREEGWLYPEEAACLLQVSISTLHRLVASGAIIKHKMRGRVLYSRREIDAYLVGTSARSTEANP
jgi:excisionase family DNA binding protein